MLFIVGVFLVFGNSICIAQQEPKPNKIEEGEGLIKFDLKNGISFASD